MEGSSSPSSVSTPPSSAPSSTFVSPTTVSEASVGSASRASASSQQGRRWQWCSKLSGCMPHGSTSKFFCVSAVLSGISLAIGLPLHCGACGAGAKAVGSAMVFAGGAGEVSACSYCTCRCLEAPSELEIQNKLLEQRIDALQLAILRLNGTIAGAQGVKASSEKLLTTLQGRDKRQEEVDAALKAHLEQIGKLNVAATRFASSQTALTTEMARIASTASEMAKVGEQAAGLRGEVKEAKTVVEEGSAMLSGAVSTLSAHIEESERSNKKIIELFTVIVRREAALTHELAELREVQGKVSAAVSGAGASTEGVQASTTVLNARISTLQEQLQASEKAKMELAEKLASTQSHSSGAGGVAMMGLLREVQRVGGLVAATSLLSQAPTSAASSSASSSLSSST